MIHKTLWDLLPTEVGRLVMDWNLEDHSMSDFQFLLKLGMLRNWKQESAVCLTDEIMGTTCTCGHTEIVVFRPCGHSVCATPCFTQLASTDDLPMETLKTGDGQTFVFANGKKDLDGFGGFECHMCCRVVQRVFRAEDVRVVPLPDDFIESIVERIGKVVDLNK